MISKCRSLTISLDLHLLSVKAFMYIKTKIFTSNKSVCLVSCYSFFCQLNSQVLETKPKTVEKTFFPTSCSSATSTSGFGLVALLE